MDSSPGTCVPGYRMPSLRDSGMRGVFTFLGLASQAIRCRRFATRECAVSSHSWDSRPRLSDAVASRLWNDMTMDSSPGTCVPGYQMPSLRDSECAVFSHSWDSRPRLSDAVASRLGNDMTMDSSPGTCVPGYQMPSLRDSGMYDGGFSLQALAYLAIGYRRFATEDCDAVASRLRFGGRRVATRECATRLPFQ